MWILTAAEVIGGTAGMALICHRIEQVMLARKGYDTRDFFRPIAGPTAPPPAVVKEIDLKRLLISEEQERQMAQSFIDNPTAFWLDPNLWGDDPDWRVRLFPPAPYLDAVPPIPALIDPAKDAQAQIVLIRSGMMPANPQMHFRSVMKDEWGDEIIRKQLADLPRGSCPSCGRSHPQCHTPLDPSSPDGWGESFLRCTQCAYEWPIPWVQNEDGSWRKRRTSAEIKARRKAEKKRKALAKRDDYDNEMPRPPRSY